MAATQSSERRLRRSVTWPVVADAFYSGDSMLAAIMFYLGSRLPRKAVISHRARPHINLSFVILACFFGADIPRGRGGLGQPGACRARLGMWSSCLGCRL